MRKLRILPFSWRFQWIDRQRASDQCELSLQFEGMLDFHYLNNDFAGYNANELFRLYTKYLAEGL